MSGLLLLSVRWTLSNVYGQPNGIFQPFFYDELRGVRAEFSGGGTSAPTAFGEESRITRRGSKRKSKPVGCVLGS